MQPIDDLLRRVARACEDLGLAYYVTGSVASMYYGEPRLTTDDDIVVELPAWKVEPLCALFPPPAFYVSSDAAMSAVSGGGQFNIIDVANGVKADILSPGKSAYDECRLSRAKRQPLGTGVEAFFAAPEDVILKKLEF